MTPWPLAALALRLAAVAASREAPWRCGAQLRAAREKLETALAGPVPGMAKLVQGGAPGRNSKLVCNFKNYCLWLIYLYIII